MVVWGTLVLDLLIGSSCFTLGLVQRQPTWLIWEGWKSKEPRGVVVDLNNLGLAHGGMNIVLDVWMLVLPFTQLYKLNHPWNKKLGIFAMFSVGIFLTVVAAVRVHNLSTFATSQNLTSMTAPASPLQEPDLLNVPSSRRCSRRCHLVLHRSLRGCSGSLHAAHAAALPRDDARDQTRCEASRLCPEIQQVILEAAACSPGRFARVGDCGRLSRWRLCTCRQELV